MACMEHGACGVNAIEHVGVVVESGLGHVLTPLLSLVARTAPPLDPRRRLSCAT